MGRVRPSKNSKCRVVYLLRAAALTADIPMPHSNRISLHWSLVVIEVLLFVASTVCAYLSQVQSWGGFIVVSVVATLVFAGLKFLEARPAVKELLVREDLASRLAQSAQAYGVAQYFNMQSAKDQVARNEETQAAIEQATNLWLCANSGASFLDPSVYRHWPFVEQKLKNGGEFRVVLLDPFSGEKRFRSQVNVSGEQLDSKVNIANLIQLHNTYPGLEIRFSEFGMHATVFATENALFFDPYQMGTVGDRIENRSFSLQIEKADPVAGVGLFRLFKSHFDTLWRTSTSFSDWMIRERANLPAGLPQVKAR